MIEAISFVVPGVPVPWARAGQSGARRFTPKPQAAQKRAIAALAAVNGAHRLRDAGDVPIGLEVVAIMPLPASWSKAKQERMAGAWDTRHKGDLDNFVKLVADALNGVAYADDRQVARMVAEKRYQTLSCEPRTLITVRPMSAA